MSKKCTIEFHYDPNIGLTWHRKGKTINDMVISAGPYKSMVHIVLDSDFLKAVESDLGEHSVQPALSKLANKFSEEPDHLTKEDMRKIEEELMKLKLPSQEDLDELENKIAEIGTTIKNLKT